MDTHTETSGSIAAMPDGSAEPAGGQVEDSPGASVHEQPGQIDQIGHSSLSLLTEAMDSALAVAHTEPSTEAAQPEQPAETQESNTVTETSHEPEPEPIVSSANAGDENQSWLLYEDDTTEPDIEEMKEIESSEYDKLSALDIAAMEEQFYTDIDDPEQRPLKKLRLSWTIRGVRGTKERPNKARVMNSPAAYVDGLYWSIKFYPRGDNCSSLSAFVRCSREAPPVDEECPENEFRFWEGVPDADLSAKVESKVTIKVPAKDRAMTDSVSSKENRPSQEEMKKNIERHELGEAVETPSSVVKETREAPESKTSAEDLPGWRVPAQLGMAIYNPAEPRTGYLQSDCHQFSKRCDDWGWVNFVGPWNEIHKRKRGQRQALLRNDTIAIDAYIRIYEDPTDSLWWHESKDESQWPSKELAGYYPMGTPGLYHSPAVAGITAWMLLAPFREILQSADGSQWKTDSSFEPKPVISQSQLVLDEMRNLSGDCYVNLYSVIEEFVEIGERFNDVKSFWDVFRRGLDLELAGDVQALQKLSQLFDAGGRRWNMPSLQVISSNGTQQGLGDFFNDTNFKGPLPNFLPVLLNRSEFDTQTRDWKLQHDRFRMDDEINLERWSTDSATDSKYTLYGFVTHVGTRNSGKYYSVLRPGGVGAKWLAFEDGNGNKIFSYSTKRVQDYEGLEGEELRKFSPASTRENAYLVMYIRTTLFKSYLPDALEPYRVPKWLKQWAGTPQEDEVTSDIESAASAEPPSALPKQDDDGVQVELYLDECSVGCENMLRLHDLRSSPVAREMCHTIKVAPNKTFDDLRHAIAHALQVEDKSQIWMWKIHYQTLGKFSRARLAPLSYSREIASLPSADRIFRIWVSVRQPLGGDASYKHLLKHLGDLESTLPTAETHDSPSVGLIDEADGQRVVPTTEPVTSADNVIVVEPDADQTSVRAGVEASVANTPNVNANADDEVGAAPSSSTDRSESSEGEDGVMTPNSSADSASHEAAVNTNANDVDTGSPDERHIGHGDDESTRAVVHGHLVDAATHISVGANPDSNVNTHVVTTDSTVETPRDGGVGAAALTQVSTEEVSPTTGPTDTPDGGEAALSQAERDSQNQTPTPHHLSQAYGHLHWFDPEEQRFVVQRPFHADVTEEIGSALRKRLKYDQERPIRIWKCVGITGTEAVSTTQTFYGAGLVSDVFTLIVGDVLSDHQVEELTQAGKFCHPQPLIKYLDMRRRKHPFAALTSTEPVELLDFGNDYYRGLLSRGRPHGPQGYLITSTGHTYEGPFVAGKKTGCNGKMTYQNGDTYVGDWLNDERHGQGEYVEKRTGNRYVGGFENGKRWGKGTTYWEVADQQADMCQICYEEEIDGLFYDCGHVCACVACARQCDTCPICRRSVRQVVRMYKA